jgi:hypothetical protein
VNGEARTGPLGALHRLGTDRGARSHTEEQVVDFSFEMWSKGSATPVRARELLRLERTANARLSSRSA